MGTGKKVNLAKVFKETEQFQKPDLEVVESAPAAQKKTAPSREQKKHVGGYFPIEVYRQMKHIGVEKNMTTQDILAAALNAWFQMHDKPPIA